jgi:hypothetical protein
MDNMILRALDRAANALTGGVTNVASASRGVVPNGPPAKPSGMYSGATNRDDQSGEKLNAEGQREIRPKKIPAPEIDQIAAYPHQGPETIRGVAEVVGFQADVGAKIDELAARFERHQADVMAHTYDAARKAWPAYNASELSKENLSDGETISFEQFADDYRRKCQTAKQRAASVALEAIELLKPLAGQFCALCNDTADSQDEGERARCERLAIPFLPSRVSTVIRKCGHQVHQQLQTIHPACGMSPRTIAAFLPI